VSGVLDQIAEPLQRQRGVAVWRQVAAQLAAEIRDLDGPRRLPSEQALARRFGVNRHTVRQALRALAEEGLVRAEQGRGTFAADLVVDYPIGRRTRFTANLEAQDRRASRHVLGAETLPAPAEIADALELACGSLVHRIQTLSFADEVPLSLGTIHLAAHRFPDAAAALAADGSITRLFERAGITDYRRRSTRILARLPSPDEAGRLRQAPVQPVLVSEGIDVDAAGRPISVARTVWAGERVQFVVGAE
jgi:GntR family phosphonate transport system transcriptional regulator